jgi:hypothetical protein
MDKQNLRVEAAEYDSRAQFTSRKCAELEAAGLSQLYSFHDAARSVPFVNDAVQAAADDGYTELCFARDDDSKVAAHGVRYLYGKPSPDRRLAHRFGVLERRFPAFEVSAEDPAALKAQGWTDLGQFRWTEQGIPGVKRLVEHCSHRDRDAEFTYALPASPEERAQWLTHLMMRKRQVDGLRRRTGEGARKIADLDA